MRKVSPLKRPSAYVHKVSGVPQASGHGSYQINVWGGTMSHREGRITMSQKGHLRYVQVNGGGKLYLPTSQVRGPWREFRGFQFISQGRYSVPEIVWPMFILMTYEEHYQELAQRLNELLDQVQYSDVITAVDFAELEPA